MGLLTFIYAENGGFLTEFEYAQMLYKEPRGISCVRCHGEKGEQVFQIDYVAFYKQREYQKEIVVDPIHLLPFEKFRAGVMRSGRFMPTYRLSNFEIKTIYRYLQKINSTKEIPKAEDIE